MSSILAVYNPSNYSRGGSIITPWEPIHEKTGINPDELVVRDNGGKVLPSQVDLVDPADPSLAVLSVIVDQVPPGPDNYSSPTAFLSLENGKPTPHSSNLIIDKVSRNNLEGYLLKNSCLEVFLNLTHTPGIAAWTWYAGSVTSVRLSSGPLKNKEILDPFSFDWEGHDPNKRCMQTDRVRILRPPWEKGTPSKESVFNHPYELISKNVGPVRASITIASAPFNYQYLDPFTQDNRNLECRLCRVINIYEASDYVVEDLFVKGLFQNEADRPEIFNLRFTARYFSHMDMGHNPYRYSHSVAWFIVGSDSPPYPGYGFATDAHVGPLCYPHQDPGFHDENIMYKRFSWQLHLSKRMPRCVHKFMFDRESTCRSSMGITWYELLFKPLKATIFTETDAL